MKLLRICLLSLAFLAGYAHTAGADTLQPLDRIVAVVNDDVILASELADKEQLIRQQLQAHNTPLPPEKVLQRQVLERLVLDNLQLQLAKRNGIRVDDETLNASLQNLAKQNNLTLEQFRDTLKRDGYSWEKFREDIRDQIIISRLRQQMVENRVQVTEQEVDNELANEAANRNVNQEYHLAHILIAVPEAATPQQVQAAKAKAEGVLDKLRHGANFKEMAVAVSAGQQALEGGDLGWRKAGQLPTIFAPVVEKMKPGDISDLIRSPSGFHIVKLLEERGGQRHVITQTLARHILIRTDDLTSDAQARARLEQLRQRIENGADFATLARANSQDPVSAAKGGDLGWVSPGELVPQFEEVMNRLKPGEISQPFKTRFGWHIVQVEARRQHDVTAEFRRNQAREIVLRRKTDEELEIWLRRLRDESYVQYRLGDDGDS